MDDVASIFDRYQSIRHRLPKAPQQSKAVRVASILDFAEEMKAFVFDAFGVLNVGDTPIPGAAERLDQLRDAGLAIRILSNAASYNHEKAHEKFWRLGMRVSPEEIITSRDAALAALDDRLWGCIAASADDLSDVPFEALRLEDSKDGYDRAEGFLFLSTESWNNTKHGLLKQSLSASSRPVFIANADVAAPRDYGFSLEPGHFGHMLADDEISSVRFFGKPFPEVFQLVEATLQGVPRNQIAMCGDTLHTDILGAAARGWSTVLVESDGMFSGVDAGAYIDQSAIAPSWRVSRI